METIQPFEAEYSSANLAEYIRLKVLQDYPDLANGGKFVVKVETKAINGPVLVVITAETGFNLRMYNYEPVVKGKPQVVNLIEDRGLQGEQFLACSTTFEELGRMNAEIEMSELNGIGVTEERLDYLRNTYHLTLMGIATELVQPHPIPVSTK